MLSQAIALQASIQPLQKSLQTVASQCATFSELVQLLMTENEKRTREMAQLRRDYGRLKGKRRLVFRPSSEATCSF
jgi:hypothetical protein